MLERILDGWLSDVFDVILSETILTELERALANPYFADRLDAGGRRAYVSLVRSHALVIPETIAVGGIASHPEDDQILSVAVTGQVDYLVTGDKQLQKLGTYGGIPIIAPNTAIALLGL